MKKEEIKNVLKTLAQSQGFYGRLLASIENNPNAEEIWETLEKQNFKDAVDIVFYFEC